MLGIIYLLLAGMLGCEASKMLTGEGRSVSGINRIWLMLPASFGVGTLLPDADEISALESELKTDYNITVEIKKAVTVSVNIDDGGTKASEQATFVKIGNRWCCMKAMEDIDFVCQNDGYNVW